MPRPLRLAIVGSGPAAFYAAEHALKQPDVQVDMIERLPTPFGLVRGGVAPDHPKIKSVTATFDKIAAHPGFRFFGNLEYGRHVTLDDLAAHFHAVIFATGAQTDRRLGIPGEDLAGSHSATEFVAWYNGHPDFQDRRFDLDVERVAIVGMGNVAVDVARILCLTPEELAATDMADAAIQALSRSRVRDVWMLGRRGLLQAAFTSNEVRELGEMAGAEPVVRPEEIALDADAAAELEAGRAALKSKVEIVRGYAAQAPRGLPRRLHLRFCVAPLEIHGDARGRVRSLTVERTRLVRGERGWSAEPTGIRETLEVGLVFRSVGYRGVPLPGLPFDERAGVIPHECGRVRNPETGTAPPGLYVSGWIKRGPSGVIGNNKADSVETVNTLVADAGREDLLDPAHPDPAAFAACAAARQPRLVRWAEWQVLDGLEVARGRADGRPRAKFTSIEAMLEALPR